MNLRKMKTRQKVDSLSVLSELWGVGGGGYLVNYYWLYNVRVIIYCTATQVVAMSKIWFCSLLLQVWTLSQFKMLHLWMGTNCRPCGL